MDKLLKVQVYFLVGQNISENLMILNLMDTEIFFGQTATSTLGNGRMVKVMEVEQKYGAMEESIQEHLKMTNCMEKEFFIILMVKSM